MLEGVSEYQEAWYLTAIMVTVFLEEILLRFMNKELSLFLFSEYLSDVSDLEEENESNMLNA